MCCDDARRENAFPLIASIGIHAKIGGVVTAQPEISIISKCIDSTQKIEPHVISHKYT